MLYREVDGQMVLLDVDREQYYGLDEVGADIVTGITSAPFDHALRELLERYEVDEPTLRRDASDLVDSLLEAGLLVRTQAG